MQFRLFDVLRHSAGCAVGVGIGEKSDAAAAGAWAPTATLPPAATATLPPAATAATAAAVQESWQTSG